MPLLPDVSMLTEDRDLGAQQFTVKRRTTKWIRGEIKVDSEKTLNPTGIIQPLQGEDLKILPEGERRKGGISIWTRTMLHLTEGRDASDEVTWQGEQYKVCRVDRWEQYGYCVAYASKR